jgi:hypothetical protein
MMWEFIGQVAVITFAVNVTLTWHSIIAATLRRNFNPWPDRENL